MRIVFCDDELDSLSSLIEVIKEYMGNITENLVVDLYDDPEKMINDIKKTGAYDLYFIDIEMPMKGDTVVKKIRELDRDAICVFLSFHREYGNMACRSRLNAYLYKNMEKNLIHYEMQHIMESYRVLKQNFEFIADGEYRIFKVYEIEYFEALKRRVMLHMVSGESFETSQYTLASIEKLPEFYYFFRLSRSLLINIHCVKYVGKHTLELQSGSTIRINHAQFQTICNHLYKMIDMGEL